MNTIHILWADDEIELLRPHILFLESKGYQVTPVNNGKEAVQLCEKSKFDLVFLDENMPGISGLEALLQIKNIQPSLPVIMITKSEEEDIMEQAIGQKIADYLIKPVNPSQIIMSIKKVLKGNEIISQKTTSNYQMEFIKSCQADHAERIVRNRCDGVRKETQWNTEKCWWICTPSTDTMGK